MAKYATVDGLKPEVEHVAVFEIPGLRWLDGDRFELAGVKTVSGRDVAWQDVIGVLRNAGIPLIDAERYTDEFLQIVDRRELARILSERMTRVG